MPTNHPRRNGLIALVVAVAFHVHAAVDVSVVRPKVEKRPEGRRVSQSVTLANEIAYYTLDYDVIHLDAKPGQVTSQYWAWKGDWATLGMAGPSKANWYWQGFFNWHFGEEGLHNWPASFRVVRQSGRDGLVEYVWDTPKAKVTVHFALASLSDKLLMFGRYEPKAGTAASFLRLSCYPTTFSKPYQRAVTTCRGTTPASARVTLDLARERWVLYEDLTSGRPADGPAGLVIGTPAAFKAVSVSVSSYQIVTQLELAPGQRTFALGLYSFPAMPDVAQTRDYFRGWADREAEAIERMAGSYLDSPLPAMPVTPDRQRVMLTQAERKFGRPAERWQPDPTPLPFPWAAKLPGGPVRAALLCPRWAAFETMELARRLELEVKHVYFDSASSISNPRAWPYRSTTGIGPIGQGPASIRAAAICLDPQVEVLMCCNLKPAAIPGGALRAIVDQVRAGKGLLITTASTAGWPKELFADSAPELAEAVLSSMAWEQIPGYRSGEPGRVTDVPAAGYRCGKGRVVVLKLGLHRYSSLVPRNTASEGLYAAADRALAVAARAVLAAAGREASHRVLLGDAGAAGVAVAVRPPAPARAEVLVRVQDDLGRVVSLRRVPATTATLALPALPTGRRHFLDAVLLDRAGRCLDFASTRLPEAGGPGLEGLALSPSTRVHEAAAPMVDAPAGAAVECRVKVTGPVGRATLHWQVADAFGRLLARRVTEAPAEGGQAACTLELPRPVTVCHVLDVDLRRGDRTLASARQRFTMRRPFPYDDFTCLMWSYAGAPPVLQKNTRACYELGADMMDLCHMMGYDDAGAAREYSVASRSGLRLIPYITRIAGEADEEHRLARSILDPAYYERVEASVRPCSRQAAPYSPVAFTLGDENYLFRRSGECCHRPESVAAFRVWLAEKYRSTDKLNVAWGTTHGSFESIGRPMLLEEAVAQARSYAPWIDHKRFMDTAFARCHERIADMVREEVPGAKVGWDGLLGYNWRSGYDFTKLTANLELNQTYVGQFLQGELVRSFRRGDALTGQWGNRIADSESGFTSHPWHCLLGGDNSVWWWTSWGCDYIPFSPDMSLNNFGKWFYRAVREIKAGPGRLLLHGRRLHSGIGVLYSQPDLFAATVMGKLTPGAPHAGARGLWAQHTALLQGLKDLGYQCRHVSYADLELGKLSRDEYRLVFLCLASCLSENQVATLRRFVTDGGTVVVDGRAGLLSGDGAIRSTRALDDLLGVKSPAGLDAIKAAAADAEVALQGSLGGPEPVSIDLGRAAVTVWEPQVTATDGRPLATAASAPVVVTHPVGRGWAVLLNVALGPIAKTRSSDGDHPLLGLLDAVVRAGGIRPACELARADGSRPLCTQRVVFADGPIRYLAVAQDLLARHLSPQPVTVRLPQPQIVYDVRAGKRVGRGPMAQWQTTIARGAPGLYALMPYEVRGLDATAPPAAKPGSTLGVTVRVRASVAAPAFHVVRLDVYPPGAARPHRQYSQNVSCPRGVGKATIPFALNDPQGTWRLALRDVASGVNVARQVRLAQ